MKDKVIKASGDIWKILGEKGELTIAQLVTASKINEDIVNQAIGWLAREDKIQYGKKGTRNVVSLIASEQQIFDAVNGSTCTAGCR